MNEVQVKNFDGSNRGINRARENRSCYQPRMNSRIVGSIAPQRAARETDLISSPAHKLSSYTASHTLSDPKHYRPKPKKTKKPIIPLHSLIIIVTSLVCHCSGE